MKKIDRLKYAPDNPNQQNIHLTNYPFDSKHK